MKPNSDKNRIRLPFIAISTSVVVFASVCIFFLVKTQRQLDYLSVSQVRVEKIYSSVIKIERIGAQIFNDADNSKGEDFLTDFEKESNHFHHLLIQITAKEKELGFGESSVRPFLFDRDWHHGENFEHFYKIQVAVANQLKQFGYLKDKPIFNQLNQYVAKLLASADPLKKSLRKERKQLTLMRNVMMGITVSGFLALLGMIILFVYRPWKKEYEVLELEKGRLQEVLKESEIRGNTFSWEVNYETKITKRSNHLSGIFEFDNESPVVNLFDEVNLFNSECQNKFMIALANCAEKGELLDFQVDMVTKNQKRYWLHYYGKRKVKNGEIIIEGTVRDITQSKLAESRFEKLFSNIQLPALIFGEGQIRKLNGAALNFFGISDGDEYDKLHPAILFPLYQLDGRSSLEKLKNSLGESKSGNVMHQDWLFQLNDGREVAGYISLFNVPFPDVDLHLMIIHDDGKRFEFERRLVDLSRKTLHARRSKLEYVTEMGIILDEMVDLVNEEISQNEMIEFGHAQKLSSIKKQLEFLWGENINQGLEEGSNSVLTDFKSFMLALEKRWQRDANKNLSHIKVSFTDTVDQYLWLDSVKLKMALNNLTQNAIGFQEKSNVTIEVKSEFPETRHGKVSFLIKTDAREWIQSDWSVLNYIDNKPVIGLEGVTPREFKRDINKERMNTTFINLVELLQGDVFFDRTDETVGIGFTCAVERVIGVSPEALSSAKGLPKQNVGQVSSSDIWSHFGGDWDIIENTIKDFFEYYPIAIADLFFYFKERDAEKLEEVATDLYGVMSHFPFFHAIERVVRIQKYAKYLCFDKVEVEINALSYELSDFKRTLQDFFPEKKKEGRKLVA